jgi:hypothetical protein
VSVKTVRLPIVRQIVTGAALAACLASASLARQEAPAQRVPAPIQRGRVYTQWFYAGDSHRLWVLFGPAMRSRYPSPALLTHFRDDLTDQLGTEQSVLAETSTAGPGYAIYRRRATFSKTSGPVLIEWTFGEDGTIGNLLVTPAPSPSAPTPAPNHTPG